MAPACRHRLAAPPLLLSDLIGHLERDAGQWDQIATEARATGGDPGRYADYAIRDRELAIWVEEAYRALGVRTGARARPPDVPHDWRPATDQDWRRLRTLLRDVRIYLEMNAEDWQQAEQDVRTIGGEHWSIGLGRYPQRAARSRELATWVDDELGALDGRDQRKVPLDERGLFPGTSVP